MHPVVPLVGHLCPRIPPKPCSPQSKLPPLSPVSPQPDVDFFFVENVSASATQVVNVGWKSPVDNPPVYVTKGGPEVLSEMH